MNKMQSRQLFAILLLSGAWSVLCLPHAVSGQLLGIPAAAAVQLLLTFPMLHLQRQGVSLTHLIRTHKWLGYVYLLFFLLWGAHGFVQLWHVSAELSLPVSSQFTAAVLLSLVCLYTASVGLRAMARCAGFVLGLLLLAVGLLTCGAAAHVDVTRLAAPSGPQGGLSYFCMGGELTAACILLDRTSAGQKRAIWGALLAKAGFACLVVFLSICAAGRLAAEEPFPFFTLTTLSQPLQFQRSDALYLLMFVMLYVMHITLQTGIIAHLLAEMYPKLKWTAPLSLIAMLSLSPLLERANVTESIWYGIFIVVTAWFIPFIHCIFRRQHHETTPTPPTPPPPAADGLHRGTHQPSTLHPNAGHQRQS